LTGADDGAIAVGIALVRLAGCFLIRKRPPLPGSPMPGVWEFPGGKCEPGETPEAAAVRETREESGLSVRVDRLRASFSHRYPHGLIALHYFDCSVEAPVSLNPSTGFIWCEAAELPGLVFPEANAPILEQLAREAAGE
jgi:mutator protein MutT